MCVSAARGCVGHGAEGEKAPEGGEEAAHKRAKTQESVASLLGVENPAERKDFLASLQIPVEEASLSCVPAEC